MKILLAAINAKYIHSNLGVYSLRAFARQECGDCGAEIEIGEYTINQQPEWILKDIYMKKPDMVGFSCYIWNIGTVLPLVRDLHRILPKTRIWLGGPEVSYRAVSLLEQEPAVAGIMKGEGEETFAEVVRLSCETAAVSAGGAVAVSGGWAAAPDGGAAALLPSDFAAVRGAAVRTKDGISDNPMRPALDMNRIPFVYEDLGQYENRIIYYESSRGCPFSCSYCLSSIDKSVRFRSLELVFRELDFFLEHRVPQVKFVDRTFNCKKSHSMAVWRHILEHDNGVTNFHFEISADLLDEEELELLGRMRPGLVQLEIGVQTTNARTIEEIHRKMDLERLKQTVGRVRAGRNIHQHLDLIAGLPYEDYDSFARSFQEVYEMKPDQLQLGFLKVLNGSYMETMAAEYGLSYQGQPPYEVLSTRWLSYADVIRLKGVEEMVEVYYNSGQFPRSMEAWEREFSSAFSMFETMAAYYEDNGLFGISHSRPARYEIFFEMIGRLRPERQEQFRELLMYDLYLRENVKSRPSFAPDQSPYKERIKAFFIEEARQRRYLKGYEGFDSRQMAKMAHLEVREDGSMILFDYLNRDPLSHNAAAFQIG